LPFPGLQLWTVERVVETGIEELALLFCPSLHLDGVQLLCPALFRLLMHFVEVPARLLRSQSCLGYLVAGSGCDLYQDVFPFGSREADVGSCKMTGDIAISRHDVIEPDERIALASGRGLLKHSKGLKGFG